MRNTRHDSRKAIALAMLFTCPLILMLWEASMGVDTVQSVREVPSKPKTIGLDKDLIRVTDPIDGTLKEANVVLTEQKYEIVLKKGAPSVPSEWTGTMHCYHLGSAKGEVPYSHAIWSYRPLAGFHLFAHGEGENYLAWISGWNVAFAEVSRSDSRTASLSGFVQGKEQRFVVRVGDMAGRQHFEGLDAFNSDIDILFVGKDDRGFLRVKVRGPRTGKVFSFLWEGKAWEMSDDRQ